MKQLIKYLPLALLFLSCDNSTVSRAEYDALLKEKQEMEALNDSLQFELAATDWAKHNGTGFSFGAALRDSATTEEYAMFAAPTPVFAGTAGYMLQEKNEPAPVIGMERKVFSPSGLFHTLELTIDSGARKFELAVTPPKGKRELVASGPIRHNTMRSFDKIAFTTSGWGAGPFLLKNIRIIH